MLAARLRLILLGEAAFYALLAWQLARHGWRWPAVALAVLALAVAGRLLVVATTYGFAHVFQTPMPESQRIGPLAFLRMALTECAAFGLLFSVIQPFERFFLGGDRLAASAGGRLPLLLVHGYECNRGFWRWQRARLERAGRTVATLNLEPVFATIDGYGEQVHRRIEEVCAATGAAQVVLVGHSMGGLAARAYLRAHGAARVARLVTLGSPHHGSRLATIGIGINARQMECGSAWLAALNQTGAVPLPADTLSAFSAYDNYVMPQDSPLLAGARTVAVGPVGHLTMAFSPAITALLLEEPAPAG